MFSGPLQLRPAHKDTAFEKVLTDIPLFCVGLMSMGLITFIFIMKRVNPTALYLCVASLLLFISAILDLGQLLTREQAGDNQDFDQGIVSGFVIAREVGLGLSSGFLFLFVWKAVAQCPKAERPKSLVWPIRIAAPVQTHSASWTRWGLLGAILKWFTLALVLVIPLLQIIWRLINVQQQYESVYIAESTLEVVASAIFVLKIILNVLISPSMSWWPPFRSYSGLVLGLLITGAMGVGNLISFAFSETVLGRFLRAISVYVLLLWNLVSIFHRRHITRQHIDGQEASATPVQLEKSKDLAIREADPELALFPRRITDTVVALDLPTPADGQRPPLRVSTASRLSVIVDRVEKNEALAEITRTLSSRSMRKSTATATAPKRYKRSELRFDIITPTLPSTAEAVESPEESPTTGISLSYYTMNPGSPDAQTIGEPPARPSQLSVSQLDGHGDPEFKSQASLIAQLPIQNASISSLDELMRQQNELDKSIAKLKLLSVDTRDNQSSDAVLPVLDNSPEGGEIVISSKSQSETTMRTNSLSPRSEFSLSVFPVPPHTSESTTEEEQLPRPNFRKLPEPPKLYVPESPSQASMTTRMVSGGTQYDVTSFIGTLTEPDGQVTEDTSHSADHVTEGQGSTQRRLLLPGSESRHSQRPMQLKPMLLPTVASQKIIPPPSFRPAHRSSQSYPHIGPKDSGTTLRPFLLGTSASVPPPLPSSTMVPLGSRRSSRPTRTPTHKSHISVPRLNALSGVDEDAPEAFERPRPPPVLTGLADRPKA